MVFGWCFSWATYTEQRGGGDVITELFVGRRRIRNTIKSGLRSLFGQAIGSSQVIDLYMIETFYNIISDFVIAIGALWAQSALHYAEPRKG